MKVTRAQALWFFMIFAAFTGTAMTLLAEEKSEQATPHEQASPKAGDTQAETAKKEEAPAPLAAIKESQSTAACLTDPAALEDVKKQRVEIDSRLKAIALKENELKARERALNEELGKLQLVREEITKQEILNKKENEEKVAKLVETFETMSPKSAAQVLSGVDETFAVAAMARISTQRLAKIMSAMEPGKSSRLSEILAGVVRARNLSNSSTSNDVAAATFTTKGGENNGGNNEPINNGASSAGIQREPSNGGGEKGQQPKGP